MFQFGSGSGSSGSTNLTIQRYGVDGCAFENKIVNGGDFDGAADVECFVDVFEPLSG